MLETQLQAFDQRFDEIEAEAFSVTFNNLWADVWFCYALVREYIDDDSDLELFN